MHHRIHTLLLTFAVLSAADYGLTWRLLSSAALDELNPLASHLSALGMGELKACSVSVVTAIALALRRNRVCVPMLRAIIAIVAVVVLYSAWLVLGVL